MTELAALWLQPFFAALIDLSLALGAGCLALGTVLPAPRRERAARAAGWGVLGAVAAYLVCATAAMTGAAPNELPGAVGQVLALTHFGRMQGLTALGAAVMLIGLRSPRRWRTGAYALGLAGVAVGRAATGHVADAGEPMLALGIHTLHLAGAGTWLGAVALGARETPVAALARRLSSVATLALAVVAASGLLNAARTLGPGGAHIASDYRQWLVAKLGAVIVATALGACNRWRHLPGLLQGDATSGRAFSRILRTEAVVLALVVALAAKLAITMPPI